MEEHQLFLGSPVAIRFTAVRSPGNTWSLIARVVHEFQDYDQVPTEEYSGLSAAELDQVLITISGRALIL